ncbi:MAG: EAL domain-containing protein [Hyphomicrobiales bacterium]|nr:MAG: EAL domain-containing protein [Hyphomicrobiales bacterium]
MFKLFEIPRDNPSLAKAQMEAFSKQVPLLYLILLVNTWTLALSHLGLGSLWHVAGFPLGLSVVCILRLWRWARTDAEAATGDEAVRRLRHTLLLGTFLGAMFVGWALSLYPLGDAYNQGHIAFYIGITVVSCIFCLMHLRPAALALTGVVLVPFTIFFLLTGRPTFTAIAVNMALVAAAMVYILIVYSRDFATMVMAREALEAKHAELTRLSEENSRLAHVDSLTDLPNRRRFFAKLGEALEAARASGTSLALGIVDLDGFKPINDVHGHGMGDRVLIETGRRMRASLGDAAFVARLGGDEFGLIFEGGRSKAELQALGDKLCNDIGALLQFSGISMHVTGSVGIALFPDAGNDSHALFERADYALYHAKHKQRGRAVLFSASHETAIRRQRLVEQHLREADLEREMELVFHPIVDIDADRVVGFEALARWHSPGLGLVSPDEFVKVAEHNDLITRLTCTLLRKALISAKTWPEHIGLSFNLSAVDISSPEAIGKVTNLIRASGIDPARIDIEVTETAIIADYDQAIASLHALKALGVRISLDDFGTGHSSLSQLHKLPIDKIKIDRSFIRDIEDGSQSFNIIKTVLVLSDTLGLPCVVEGIESSAQVDILQQLHAQMMQGYLFSKPLAADKVLDYLREKHSAAPAAA